MATNDEHRSPIPVALPADTLAALEEIAREQATTASALAESYIRYGLDQAILGRKFDLAMARCSDW
ncbi:hypothetical protein [Sphingopyxis panaciterrae]